MIKEIQEMPKVVEHIHLDGSLRPETVREWIGELTGKTPKLEEVKQLLMVKKDCRDLNEYLEKFDIPVKMLQTKEHIQRATYELYEDLAKQNVIYAEVRYAPSKHLMKGLSYDEVVKASIDGLEKAKKDFGIDGSLILCCMRGDKQEEHIETLKSAKKYLNNGVSAVDLAGAEAIFPTADYKYIFDNAKDMGIPYTIHAGEADGPESIKKALEFGTKRLGHGVRCIEDPNLIKEITEEGITLEICLISNLQTQAVKGKHPLEQLYKAGINTTISTDNNTVSNTNILEEYEYILNTTNLTIQDLLKMNENAALSIFAPETKKKEVVKRINAYKSYLYEQEK